MTLERGRGGRAVEPRTVARLADLREGFLLQPLGKAELTGLEGGPLRDSTR